MPLAENSCYLFLCVWGGNGAMVGYGVTHVAIAITLNVMLQLFCCYYVRVDLEPTMISNV